MLNVGAPVASPRTLGPQRASPPPSESVEGLPHSRIERLPNDMVQLLGDFLTKSERQQVLRAFPDLRADHATLWDQDDLLDIWLGDGEQPQSARAQTAWVARYNAMLSQGGAPTLAEAVLPPPHTCTQSPPLDIENLLLDGPRRRILAIGHPPDPRLPAEERLPRGQRLEVRSGGALEPEPFEVPRCWHGPISDYSFSEEGEHLGTLDATGRLTLWQVTPAALLPIELDPNIFASHFVFSALRRNGLTALARLTGAAGAPTCQATALNLYRSDTGEAFPLRTPLFSTSTEDPPPRGMTLARDETHVLLLHEPAGITRVPNLGQPVAPAVRVDAYGPDASATVLSTSAPRGAGHILYVVQPRGRACEVLLWREGQQPWTKIWPEASATPSRRRPVSGLLDATGSRAAVLFEDNQVDVWAIKQTSHKRISRVTLKPERIEQYFFSPQGHSLMLVGPRTAALVLPERASSTYFRLPRLEHPLRAFELPAMWVGAQGGRVHLYDLARKGPEATPVGTEPVTEP